MFVLGNYEVVFSWAAEARDVERGRRHVDDTRRGKEKVERREEREKGRNRNENVLLGHSHVEGGVTTHCILSFWVGFLILVFEWLSCSWCSHTLLAPFFTSVYTI